ncbi:hypothetical protein ABZ957_15515 [Streptomyces sp. NPDC046316]|uniref:hypothetical protein n=1 Tax=Streptomyces sp. NPDC046316 TaxID=3154494 RepID=UPI0033C56422
MLRIITARTNRQRDGQIVELHDRSESRRRWWLGAEKRIEQALALLDGQDSDLARQLRATLKEEQR